jgi:hypothetical protein
LVEAALSVVVGGDTGEIPEPADIPTGSTPFLAADLAR